MQWGEEGRRGAYRHALWSAHSAAISLPPLAFARLGPTDLYSTFSNQFWNTRPFQISSGTLGMWDGQHEAHFVRRGPIVTTFAAALMVASVSCCAGEFTDSNGPPTAVTDPLVRYRYELSALAL
jgi:hypothetical protein